MKEIPFSDEWTGWKVRQVWSHDQAIVICVPVERFPADAPHPVAGKDVTVLAQLHSFSSILKKKENKTAKAKCLCGFSKQGNRFLEFPFKSSAKFDN